MRRMLGMIVLMVAWGLAAAPSAQAACHAFDVEVNPANPGEGATVQVTVTRDAAVNPSSVRLRSVDGTATAGQDYQPVDQRVDFTSDVEQTLTVATIQDSADEADETFDLVLSEGQGCPVNTNFSYGSATVTIVDDDEPAATTVPPTQPPATTPTTAAAAPTTTADTTSTTTAESTTTSSDAADAAAGTSTTAATSEVSTTTALSTDEVAASSDGDDSSSAGALLALAAVLAVGGAGAAFTIYRFRGSRSA